MKKTIKGSRSKALKDVIDYLSNLELDEEKEKNEVYVITVDENRSIPQNRLIHSALRLLAEEMGEDNIEKLKRDLKQEMGLFTDYIVDTKNGRTINREFESTADFSKKKLSAFYDYICRQAMENFQLDINGILELDHGKINFKNYKK